MWQSRKDLILAGYLKGYIVLLNHKPYPRTSDDRLPEEYVIMVDPLQTLSFESTFPKSYLEPMQ